ncbi:hypothetical protein G5V57_22250 [Nordella sp. HKS 07]|uniref:hypothetical protein n=1 Tax=Nordella sp. HKS 07 TaxID=2712222 RepID=UPI0013E151F1|nr:hypothetical protein [Nordella sp. HKS 07]QIG50204.1 hypothetical protein G5V57_22250 [Nordella sp. HKS 07]
MKSNQQRKTAAQKAEQQDSEAGRPIWFLGKEIKVHPAKDGKKEVPAAEAKTEEAGARKPEKTATVDEPEQESTERGPSQLEAYMRYAKMRQPVSDEEETLAPVRTRRFPTSRYAASNENEHGWNGEAPQPRRPRQAHPGFRMRDAALAGLASIAIGALAGAVVYDRANNGELSSAVFDSLGGFMTGFGDRDKVIADAGKAGVSVVEEQHAVAASKKSVTTARLDVSDAKGDVNSPIPLNISAEPALPNQDIAFRLSGLPADAYLSAGTKLADNAWMLKPGEEHGVKLMVPSVPAAPLLIAVEAIEPGTGDLAAPAEEMKVALATPAPTSSPAPAATQSPPPAVQPASAPPTDVRRNFNLPSTTKHDTPAAQPIPEPLENNGNTAGGDSDSLMRNGDKLLGLGDFTAARAFFSKARELGNREASLRLGQTYDPLVFREKNVQGLKADPAMALKYYLEARTAGIADAETAIAGLETWMKQ